MDELQYTVGRQYWRDGGTVLVQDAQGNMILEIPCAFLESSQCMNWQYILEAVKTCVDEDGGLFASDGRAVSPASASAPDGVLPVQAGRYTYRRRDHPEQSCTYSRGPESKTRGRPPTDSASETTVSNSNRSSAGQNRFRGALMARDGYCILTQTVYTRCTAAHIVPFSRRDIYARLLGVPVARVNLYDTSAGFLVLDSYHRSFDRYEWSLYSKGDDLVVHFFQPDTPQDFALHGKVISPSFFRCTSPAQQPPNRALLQWHYQQCVQMRFRGFSARMTAADALAEVAATTVP